LPTHTSLVQKKVASSPEYQGGGESQHLTSADIKFSIASEYLYVHSFICMYMTVVLPLRTW